MDIDVSVQKKKRPRSYNSRISAEQKLCIDTFEHWSDQDQVEFLCCLLSRMSHSQHSQINKFLEPLLQRDFIIALQVFQLICTFVDLLYALTEVTKASRLL
ncbi:unnamed protein product [Dibothriocephalus latus]|uniref:D domain-containing protein n=1 Tax=Dibothriocephalus latus TaxID=60516 RepID=A0A3P6PD78_DIBLA|nr:unnamed protein product [Dibothriocephalus latus]